MHRDTSNNHYAHPDHIYQDLVKRAMEHGFVKADRTGTGTHALFGEMARYNLINGRTPRLTTKKLSDNPEREMLWFRDGTSSIKTLRDQGIGIWNSWLIEGSAKYREKTYDELLENLRKKLKVDAIIAGYITHAEYDEVIQNKKGINHHGRYVIQISLKEESLLKTATVYGSDDEFDNHEDMVKHVATDLKVDMHVLVDGDIGPGGYGPQWRHWQDTQIVSQRDLPNYRQQGYKVKGNIRPETEFATELDIQDALIKLWKQQGFEKVAFEGRKMGHLNERGYDIETSENSIYVVYDSESSLETLYIAVADLPRFVVHREIDQLANAIELLKTNPDSRRIIVTAWNPAKIWQAALPACHLYHQYVSHELTVEQRVRIHNDRIQLAQHDERREEKKTGMANLVLRTWNYIGLAQERASGKTDEQLHAELDQLCIKRRGLSLFVLLR